MKPVAVLLLFFVSVGYNYIFAQSNGQPADVNELPKAIVYHDSIFWEAYNRCDVEKMAAYFTDDVEFYHDKAGPTFTLAKLADNTRNGLCGKPDWRLRREAIAGTVKVFPLNNYGGVITGEHVFYINEAGKKEFLDGYGKFTQLWQFKDNQWKMSRIISYDHGPAPYINKRKEAAISKSTLDRYAGEYKSDKAGSIKISPELQTLRITSSNMQLSAYAESNNKFFVKDRDLQFEFIILSDKVTKVIVYEKGNPVDEMIRK